MLSITAISNTLTICTNTTNIIATTTNAPNTTITPPITAKGMSLEIIGITEGRLNETKTHCFHADCQKGVVAISKEWLGV